MERMHETSSSLEKFRKSGKQRDTQIASDEEFKDAIQTGILNAKTGGLTVREIKDRANVVSSWIESNKDSLNLSQKEEETFRTYKKNIHDNFFDARYFIINKIKHTQSLMDNCYKYFEFGQILQDPVERLYFAKDIHSLRKEEIQQKNEYFDKNYNIKVAIGCDRHEWEFNTNLYKLRIVIMVYNKEGNKNPPYRNAVNLDNYSIEGWNNMRFLDTLPDPKRMHLSDIKYQILREALKWLKKTDNPDFQQYKNLSIDNFQPHSLSGNYITHLETKRTVFQVIEGYKRRKQNDDQPLTQEENDGIFFFPSGSNEFKQITFETILGKEKLFFLRNYFPDLRCTGVRIRAKKGRTTPQLRGSGSIEDDIASENTNPSEDSDGSHPPQVNHYQLRIMEYVLEEKK